MPVHIEEISYQLSSRVINGLACGNKLAKPTLCLHGWLDNAASFIPFMSALSDDILMNNRFIAIDWPGHGKSSHRSTDAHYHFFDYIYDLVELFELNHWNNSGSTKQRTIDKGVDIVAHSMGAMVASAFAAAFHENVKSLTLIDSLGFIYAEAKESTNQLRKGMMSRLKTAQVIAKEQPRNFSKETAIKARLAVSDLTHHNASLLVSRSLARVVDNEKNNSNGSYCWRSDPRLRTISPYRVTKLQATQMMSDINCPIRLIYGDKGMDMVQQGIACFSHLLKGLSMTKLKGGHHVHMEQPELLVHSLIECGVISQK